MKYVRKKLDTDTFEFCAYCFINLNLNISRAV